MGCGSNKCQKNMRVIVFIVLFFIIFELDCIDSFFEDIEWAIRTINLHERIIKNLEINCKCTAKSETLDLWRGNNLLITGENYTCFHEWMKIEDKISSIFEYNNIRAHYKSRKLINSLIRDWISSSLIFLRSDGKFQKSFNSARLNKAKNTELYQEIIAFMKQKKLLVNYRYVWCSLRSSRGIIATPELVYSSLCELCEIYPGKMRRFLDVDLFYFSS